MDTQSRQTFSMYGKMTDKSPERKISLEEVFNIVTSGMLEKLTLAVFKASEAGDSREAAKLKRMLPCIAVHAIYEGRRTADKASAHTGMMLADIDGTKRPPHEVVKLCRTLPYVAFAQVSPRQKGVHILVRTAGATLETHALLYPLVMHKVSQAIGEKCDTSCKDLARIKYLSHDPDAYINPDATPLETEAADAILPADRLRMLRKYLDTVPHPTKGNRHNAMVSLAANLNRCGFDLNDAACECTMRFSENDFTATEIYKIFSDIYSKHSHDFGTNRREFQAMDRGTSPKFANFATDVSKNDAVPQNMDEPIDIHEDNTFRPVIPEIFFNKLPNILKSISEQAETPVWRDVDTIGAIAFIGSVMHNVTGRFAKEKQHPNLFFSLIGEPASGKGRLARLHAILNTYHRHIYNLSRLEVKEYEEKLDEYENYIRTPKEKRASMRPPKPQEVYQRNLDLSGNISKARLVQQLYANRGYGSCLFDSELENITKTIGTDYGPYMSVINQAFHYETVQNNTLARGSELVYDPLLTVVLSGTPGMFRRLIPGMDNGTFSRMLVYRLSNENKYIPVTGEDENPESETFLSRMADKVFNVAQYLADSPTRVMLTDAQRMKLNRYFASVHAMNIVTGNADRNSVSNRMRINIYRICMVLTALRKAEEGWKMSDMYVSDDDFDFAMAAGKTLLGHSNLMATSMQDGTKKETYYFPYKIHEAFKALPDKFSRKEACVHFGQVNCSPRSVDRMIKTACRQELITCISYGYYSKTDKGKSTFTF